MILVDTSVIIDMLKGNRNDKQTLFEEIHKSNTSWCISSFTYQEVLQGARDLRDYDLLKSYLDTQNIVYPPSNKEFYALCSGLYFQLRRRGKTVRSSIDLLIAGIAIQNSYKLLHNDRDFDVLSEEFSELESMR